MNHLSKIALFESFKKHYLPLYNYIMEAKSPKQKWRRMNAYINYYKILPIIEIGANQHIPLDLNILKPVIDKYPNKIILAGGAVCDIIIKNSINDYDIFIIGTLEEFNKIKAELLNILIEWDESLYVITAGDIQIIKKSYNSIKEILSNFDLPASKIAINLSNNFVYATPDCLYSLSNMEIGTNYKVNGRALLYRYKKYKKKGFKIIKADVKSPEIKDIINCASYDKATGSKSAYDLSFSNVYAVKYKKPEYFKVKRNIYNKTKMPKLDYIIHNFDGHDTLLLDHKELAEAEYIFNWLMEKLDNNFIDNTPLTRLPSNNWKDLKHPDEFYGPGAGIQHIQCGFKLYFKIQDEIILLAWSMRLRGWKIPKYIYLYIWSYL